MEACSSGQRAPDVVLLVMHIKSRMNSKEVRCCCQQLVFAESASHCVHTSLDAASFPQGSQVDQDPTF